MHRVEYLGTGVAHNRQRRTHRKSANGALRDDRQLVGAYRTPTPGDGSRPGAGRLKVRRVPDRSARLKVALCLASRKVRQACWTENLTWARTGLDKRIERWTMPNKCSPVACTQCSRMGPEAGTAEVGRPATGHDTRSVECVDQGAPRRETELPFKHKVEPVASLR